MTELDRLRAKADEAEALAIECSHLRIQWLNEGDVDPGLGEIEREAKRIRMMTERKINALQQKEATHG
jgi:hypothetical protein